MKKNWFLLLLVALAVNVIVQAGEVTTIADAFKEGKVKGTVGTYFEYVKEDKDNADFSWATGYLYLKYETAEWNRLKFGVGFFGHNQLYNEFDAGAGDRYLADIETRYAMPEAYLSAALTEKTKLVVGRYNHKKISHIDDAQSAGFYLQSKEIDNVEIVFGGMNAFAEIDYDDGEDFSKDSQQLNRSTSNNTVAEDTDDWMFYLELKAKIGDVYTVNPYVMHQGGVATVFGLDNDLAIKSGDAKFGVRADLYQVTEDTDYANDEDAFCWAIAPFVGVGPVTLTVGYAEFDGSDTEDALNKPFWLKDYLVSEMDQDKPYGNDGCEVFFGKVKGKFGDFWAHIAYASYDDYVYNGSTGDASTELELQVGYKITKNADINLRFFDVTNDTVSTDPEDYQKVEGRIRFKF